MAVYLKISELPAASSAALTDQLEVNQAGTSRSLTITQLLASGASAGDFCANQTSAYPALTTSATTLILTQVVSGNSTAAYSTSTGRYTPPAGRFLISAGFSAANASGATIFVASIRKNGTVIVTDYATAAAANQYDNPQVSVTVDANGTDWFDLQGHNTSAGTVTYAGLTFQAFPISGIKGPPGDPGAMFLSGAGAPTMSAAKGTLYTRTDATTTTTRLYVNTDGGTTWANFTASA